jgi:hypothetical protein
MDWVTPIGIGDSSSSSKVLQERFLDDEEAMIDDRPANTESEAGTGAGSCVLAALSNARYIVGLVRQAMSPDQVLERLGNGALMVRAIKSAQILSS